MRFADPRAVSRAGVVGAVVSAVAGIVIFTVLAAAGPKQGAWWVSAYAVAVVLFTVVLTLLVLSLNRERAQTAETLERVHDAMRTVTASPELEPTLQTLANGAAEAVGAAFTMILLREGDEIYLRAWSGLSGRRERFEALPSSPLGHVFQTGEVVVVERPSRDPRFAEWVDRMRPTLEAAGIEGGIGVPLRVDDAIVGVLGSMFTTRGAATPAAVRTLELYAEQAAVVIVRAQAYEHERELARRLADADRLKSEFLALVSHELRTPLTSVKGFVDTLRLHWDQLDDARRRSMLERAGANADELARLVERLLEYSRVEAGEIDLVLVAAPLRVLVEDVVAAVEPALGGHAVAVEVSDDVVVTVDRHAFAHVLTNLLTNAAKFSPPSAAVIVAASRDPDEVVLAVTDEGPGLPLDEQERVFERFYRSGEPSRRGTGLGLAIARSYVKRPLRGNSVGPGWRRGGVLGRRRRRGGA